MNENVPVAEIIERIESLCFSDPWNAESIAETLNNSGAVCFLEYADGNAAGYLIGMFSPDECELYRIAVLPEYRKKGIGEKLVAALIEESKKRRAQRILLEVKSENVAAVGLYLKTGFNKTAVRKGYYGNDDAWIFERAIMQ